MCSGVNGFKRRTVDLAEESAGQEIALTCHASGLVGVECVVLQACCDVEAHPLGSLRAWCECDVLWLCADDDSLYLVCCCWGLSFARLHVVPECAVEVLECLKARIRIMVYLC